MATQDAKRATSKSKNHQKLKHKSRMQSRNIVFRKSEFAQTVHHDCKYGHERWVHCWKWLPRFIWLLFIEACLVPLFRHEWGRYSQWKPWDDLVPQPRRHKFNFLEKLTANINGRTIPMMVDPLDPPVHDHHNCQIVRINVGGRIFETQIRTLHRYPSTLLGNPARRMPFFDPIREYYYFDRSRKSFEAILYFYQSGGRLSCPMDVPADEFFSELEFFDLPPQVIRNFELEEGLEQEDELESIKLPEKMFQRKIWLLLEYPTSSTQATIVSIFSVYVIVLSVVEFCVETEPAFRRKENITSHHSFSDEADDEFKKSGLDDPFGMVETVCIWWFGIELFLRYASCPEKCKFFNGIMNLVDIVAIVPYVANWISLTYSGAHVHPETENASIAIFRIIRLVRVFRIFKLSRHVNGLKVLGWTLKASFNELMLLIFFLCIGAVLFSSAVYFAEDAPDSQFSSIPQAFYWAVTTMTTVGYGDVVPTKIGGKVIGSLCAVAGVLTLALPVPVMVSNFNYFYNMEMSRHRTMTERLSPVHHVLMCPYLPGGGIHPDVLKEKEQQHDQEIEQERRNTGGKREGRPSGDSSHLSDTDESFNHLKQ